MTQPLFLARFLRDGSTALQCRQSGTRYIIAAHRASPRHDDCGCYREGRLIAVGPRAAMINAVESDARWGLHNGH